MKPVRYLVPLTLHNSLIGNFSFNLSWFEKCIIVASNDINEDTIHSLNQQVCFLSSDRFKKNKGTSYMLHKEMKYCLRNICKVDVDAQE